MEADLATAEGRKLVLFWLINPRLAGIFAVPMCETSTEQRLSTAALRVLRGRATQPLGP